jgi:thiol-disulfide isomerase/thioredoxin
MFLKIFTLLLCIGTAARADEKLATLKVQDEVYTNVFVTSVTATDVYFTHAKGMGNAKMKNLSPDLQKHFHYDANKGAQAEKAQTQANIEFRKELLTKPAPARPVADSAEEEAPAAAGDDFVAPKISARSIRGQRAPDFVVEQWLTPAPEMTGKFILIDFWATWCGPCRASIPELNQLHAKYKDRLTVIGVSDETEAAVRKMNSPRIDYAVAIDTQGRMNNALAIRGIPHCILIDSDGIVRYEGHPGYLTDTIIGNFLAKYGK